MKVVCFRGDSKVGKSEIIKKILKNFFKVNIIHPRLKCEKISRDVWERKNKGKEEKVKGGEEGRKNI